MRTERGGQKKDKAGYYWTSDVCEDWQRGAYVYQWYMSTWYGECKEIGNQLRYCGLTVRAVRD
jgi:hypothetical protein